MNEHNIPYETAPSLMELFANFIGWEMADVVSHIKETPSAREIVLINKLNDVERSYDAITDDNTSLVEQVGKLQIDLAQAENMIKFQECEIESTNSLMDGHRNHIDYLAEKLATIVSSRWYRWFKWTI